ncbi:MAG: CHAT domain-containing protein [Planctomycetales bacterium]|nr:CHAT domain-containing protein [Planctomycetales bacterium]
MLAISRNRRARIVLACAVVAGAGLAASQAAGQTLGQGRFAADTVPSQGYYLGIEQLYQGDYADAIRRLQLESTGGIKTVNARFVDSICYFAMLGEAYYQAGRIDTALQQFDQACNLILQNPTWMLRIQFDNALRPDARVSRRLAPWGVSGRGGVPGSFSSSMLYSQGQIDNSAVAARGGVVQQAQFWQLNVVEVVQASALAIRRRNEILGPLAKYDKISNDLVRTFTQRGAPPNHWSNAWIDVQRGVALAGVGNTEEALKYLERGLLIAGQFDHPLTSVALLEEGRLAMEAGDAASADRLLAEASFSAYQFEDVRIVDEALRLAARNRMGAGVTQVNPAWDAAAAWARRERFDHVYSRIRLATVDELLAVGDLAGATAALKDAQSRLRDARNGLLGIVAGFLDAKLQFAAGRDSAFALIAKVLAAQAGVSLHNFQIAYANGMFDDQTLNSRSALEVYEQLLRDPSAADLALDLLDSLAYMKTPNQPAFDRWLTATLERNNVAATIAVADLAKRRRFHQQLPWGGRLAAVRTAVATPESMLSPTEIQARRDLLVRVPELGEAVTAEATVREEILRTWTPALDDEGRRDLARLWKEYNQAVGVRETRLASAALDRLPADYAFPPRAAIDDVQQRLLPGEAVLVFHDTPTGLLGMLLTAQASTQWDCGPSNRVGGVVTQFLRDIGNYDAHREMTTDQLADDEWHVSSQRLFKALFGGSSLAPQQLKELVIIPDGVTWYVPFEALWIEGEDRAAPLASFAKVRYAPTLGLAFRHRGPWRRVRRTGVIVGDLPPGDDAEDRAAAAMLVEDAVENPMVLDDRLGAPAALAAGALDGLVVLDDVDANTTQGAFGWNPAPLPGDRRGSLGDWLLLAGAGPQRIAIPGMHTLAEAGGRGSRRKGAVGPGDELFDASCALMAAGAETMLLSRWRVGGQSTLQLTHDFLQEAPHAAAAAAWQRSVQLAMESPVDPVAEMRVKQGKKVAEITASHPFFWAGYLVVDSGWRPPEPEPEPETAEPAAAEAPAAAPPALPAAAAMPETPPADPPPEQPAPPELRAGGAAEPATAVE